MGTTEIHASDLHHRLTLKRQIVTKKDMNRPRKKLRSDKTETVVIIKGKGSKQNFNIMIDFEQKKSCELQTLPASKIIVNENTKYFYIIFL